MAITFGHKDLPPLYHAADQSSAQQQARFLTATKFRLGAVVAAAFSGLFVWKFGPSPVDWAGVVGAICFGIALLVEVYVRTSKPERTWYEGRAAAESVKTLCWRYMMDAEPFIREQQPVEADELFLRQLDDVLDVVKDLEVVADVTVGAQITDCMRAVRTAPLAERKKIYEQNRVGEQQAWYLQKAQWNRDRANRWSIAMLVVEAVGIVAATLKAVGSIEGDWLGLASAVVAAMSAWLQSKQHQTLATAYAVTALELASVRSRIQHQVSEADWAKFVSDAEEAFSREHTLWKASRGVRSIPKATSV